MRKIALTALLLLSVSAFGQLPANQTTPNGDHNGRFWVGLADSYRRQVYLIGFFDGIDRGTTHGVNDKNKRERMEVWKAYTPKATIGEIETALDRFYASPENLNIPIWRAILIATLKFAARPASEVEAEMEIARSVLRDEWEDCEKENLGCEHLR